MSFNNLSLWDVEGSSNVRNKGTCAGYRFVSWHRRTHDRQFIFCQNDVIKTLNCSLWSDVQFLQELSSSVGSVHFRFEPAGLSAAVQYCLDFFMKHLTPFFV